MIDAFNHNAPERTARDSLQAVLDLLDPLLANVDKLYDRDETCWRRSVDDPAVWTTAGRSRVATGRVLLDAHGPLKWRTSPDEPWDFIVKLTDGKGRNG
jgi:hypothetical protein